MKKVIFLVFGLIFTGCNGRFVEVAEKVMPKTAMVEVTAIVSSAHIEIHGEEITITNSTRTVTYLGAAVAISPYGHLLSCAHLVNHGVITNVKVSLMDCSGIKAEVLYKDVDKDLLLLKIDKYTPDYATLVSPNSLKVGQEVVAVGNPLGFEWSVTHGIISSIGRNQLTNATQTDTFINPGNSGGPLFNLDGELVGINSYLVPPVNGPIFTGLGFSVSPELIVEFIEQFRGIDNLISY